jgi:hypothetical protein
MSVQKILFVAILGATIVMTLNTAVKVEKTAFKSVVVTGFPCVCVSAGSRLEDLSRAANPVSQFEWGE